MAQLPFLARFFQLAIARRLYLPLAAERLIQQYVDHYNNVRLHSALDMLAGND